MLYSVWLIDTLVIVRPFIYSFFSQFYSWYLFSVPLFFFSLILPLFPFPLFSSLLFFSFIFLVISTYICSNNSALWLIFLWVFSSLVRSPLFLVTHHFFIILAGIQVCSLGNVLIKKCKISVIVIMTSCKSRINSGSTDCENWILEYRYCFISFQPNNMECTYKKMNKKP